jgi:hypothetical protein
METAAIISLIQTVGLPIVILAAIIWYFYGREQKREQVILVLNNEKIQILSSALERYAESEKSNIAAINSVNEILNDLKNEIKELRYKIDTKK